MFVPATLGAFAEVFTNGPAGIVKIMIALGFPLYLMKILGVAKILGGIAILTGRLPRMKEWAYGRFRVRLSWRDSGAHDHRRPGIRARSLLILRGPDRRLHSVAQDSRDGAAVRVSQRLRLTDSGWLKGGERTAPEPASLPQA